MNRFRRPHVILERHVALTADGRGATFTLVEDKRTGYKWSWSYDPDISIDNPTVMFFLMPTVDRAIFQMERLLGIPTEAPHWLEDPSPPTDLKGWPWELQT